MSTLPSRNFDQEQKVLLCKTVEGTVEIEISFVHMDLPQEAEVQGSASDVDQKILEKAVFHGTQRLWRKLACPVEWDAFAALVDSFVGVEDTEVVLMGSRE